MKIKDTIFESGDEKYHKAWKDKKTFPLLQEKFDDICSALTFYIDQVYCFDQLALDWKDWKSYDNTVLVILPDSYAFKPDSYLGDKLKQLVPLIDSSKLFPITVFSNEYYDFNESIIYFPTRNLVVARFNPFLDIKLYDLFIDDLHKLSIKTRNKEEIELYLLEKRWNDNIISNKERIRDKLTETEYKLDDLSSSYKDYLLSKRNYIHQLKEIDRLIPNIKNQISEQLAFLKSSPLIKNLLIKDAIYFDFGEIKIKGDIQTDIESNDGLDTPIIETKEVSIGIPKFCITNDRIFVSSNNEPESLVHPHVSEENEPCFGELDLDIKEALVLLDYKKLISLLYSWAFSYNDGDRYIELQRFWEELE